MLEAAENILPFGRSAVKNRENTSDVIGAPIAFTALSDIEKLASHLQAVLPKRSHPLHKAAQHHFASPGKLLRSRVALAACLQQGMQEDAALDWAIAIELLHNASLVHDDICDDDHLRRNRPSLWAAHGRAAALCFGDWLIGKSFELAARAQSLTGKPFAALLATTMSELSTGQAGEFIDNEGLDCDSYLAIVAGKTTPLFMAAIEGAFLAGKAISKNDIKACRSIFEHIGFAYQIANDIDNHQALKAGAATGDLLRGAPNAVYICYRAELTLQKRAQFDKWQATTDKRYSGSWLADINASGAEDAACSLFAAHLQAVATLQNALSDDLGRLVAPITAYLAGSK